MLRFSAPRTGRPSRCSTGWSRPSSAAVHLRCLPKDQANYSFPPLVDRDEVVTRLERITAPTLVLHGSADPCYAPSHGEEIANGVADCRGFVLVEGGAHFLSLTGQHCLTGVVRGTGLTEFSFGSRAILALAV
jgi:pimeloyl-ACP methyl ester carboxylesterase